MRALLVLLTLAVASAGYAVEPFVAVAFHPTLMIPHEQIHYHGTSYVAGYYYAEPFTVTLGLKRKHSEWYIRYRRADSEVEGSGSSEYIYSPEEYVYYHSRYGDQIVSANFLVGGRWVFHESSTANLRLYAGSGVGLGKVEWHETGNFSTQTFDENTGRWSSVTYYDNSTTHESDWAWAFYFEYGTTFRVYHGIALELTSQILGQVISLGAMPVTNAPTHLRRSGEYIFIEPSASLGLRYDLGRLK